MNNIDIIEIFLLCAVVFIPLGYALSYGFPRVKQKLRITLMKPKFVKSAGILRRGHSVKAPPENE